VTLAEVFSNSHIRQVKGRVGWFLPQGGKNRFSMVKTGPAKILFASKNRFLPELSSK